MRQYWMPSRFRRARAPGQLKACSYRLR
jgi:hypothetical protein